MVVDCADVGRMVVAVAFVAGDLFVQFPSFSINISNVSSANSIFISKDDSIERRRPTIAGGALFGV